MGNKVWVEVPIETRLPDIGVNVTWVFKEGETTYGSLDNTGGEYTIDCKLRFMCYELQSFTHWLELEETHAIPQRRILPFIPHSDPTKWEPVALDVNNPNEKTFIQHGALPVNTSAPLTMQQAREIFDAGVKRGWDEARNSYFEEPIPVPDRSAYLNSLNLPQ